MEHFFMAFAVLGTAFLSVFLVLGMAHLFIRHNQKQEKTSKKQHPNLALIALPVVYVQMCKDGVIIQDSKQRLHYFTNPGGYRWEPLENIEL